MTAPALSYPLILMAYLLGSVPWGLVLTRWAGAEDIRYKGSGNIGATNVTRLAGKRLGFLTLLLDILKGAFPVYLVGELMRSYPPAEAEAMMGLTAIAAFLGHLYPIFLKFKTGGKGVATAFGCFAIISPLACGGAAAIFFLVFRRVRIVSVSSLFAAAALPVGVALAGKSIWSILAAGIISAGIFFRHSANIGRLIDGTEPVFGKAEKKA